jgi:hypothetical protein
MSSVVSDFKQSHGYFITTTTGCVGYYQSVAPSGAGGSYVGPTMAQLSAGVSVTALALSGTILRDLGKTVLVGGIGAAAGATSAAGTTGVPTRVFRKVQLLNAPATVVGQTLNVANGVGGNAADAAIAGMFNTFYIELPTLGRSGGSTNLLGGQFAYINSLPGLYV